MKSLATQSFCSLWDVDGLCARFKGQFGAKNEFFWTTINRTLNPYRKNLVLVGMDMDEQYLSLEGLLALSLFLPPLSMRQYNAVLETLRRVEMPYYYKY